MLEPPSARYLFGTDDLGRDVLSRAIHGARTSLLVGVITTGVSMVLGTALGVVSGYCGHAVDVVLQRVMDAIQAVSGIVLLLFIAVVLGPSVRNTIIALTVVITPSFNLIAPGETLRVCQERYIESARATGAGPLRILTRHVLPNMFALVLTLASLIFAGVIIAESALSFLGIGAPPPTPSWAACSRRASATSNAPRGSSSSRPCCCRSACSASTCSATRCATTSTPAATRWWGMRRPPTRLAPALAAAADRQAAADEQAAGPPSTPGTDRP